MTPTAKRADRRTDALSKERIIESAIGILDTEGERALTFRALTARLSTGAGAIYWHVSNKDELLAEAADTVIRRGVGEESDGGGSPLQAIRAVSLAVFDAIEEHPWVGAQLSREPWQAAILLVLERFGEQLRSLGLPDREQFDSASALVNYLLGLAGQHAAGARVAARGSDRTTFLASVADRWSRLDSGEYPFVHLMAEQLPGHDDRDQFLAGIDLILAGIAAGR